MNIILTLSQKSLVILLILQLREEILCFESSWVPDLKKYLFYKNVLFNLSSDVKGFPICLRTNDVIISPQNRKTFPENWVSNYKLNDFLFYVIW